METSRASEAVSILFLLLLVADVRVEAHGINISQVARVTRALGLKLHDKAAERAFFAKDFGKVKEAHFRALQARAEKAKREEERLTAAKADLHQVTCNKLIKLGTETVTWQSNMIIKEHLTKFNKNFDLLQGTSCKDTNF